MKVADVYRRVPVRRPREAVFAGPAGAGVRVLGIEVTQAIQTLGNTVALVAGKATLVRVYLDHASVARPLRLRGEIVWRRREAGPAAYLPAQGEIRLDPGAPQDCATQRADLRRSLNFHLPEAATRAGPLHLALGRLTQTGGEDQPFSGPTTLALRFEPGPPLRIRCIGLRYRHRVTGARFTPDATHFAYLRSFLRRAYPVAEVDWTQIVLDADFSAPFDAATPTRANAQLAALRNADLNAGADPRVHYYGLVDDANGHHFMRGRAAAIPAGARPDTVAAGPCGIPEGYAGDRDLSYADWYGAHELGHTFGRAHPGYPVGAQDSSDPAFPYANGRLSDGDGAYAGFDAGDAELGLAPRALPGTEHHDIMTYAPRQWLSAHTYEAIRRRLREEDLAHAPAGG